MLTSNAFSDTLVTYLREPLLEFGLRQCLEYTRDGLFLYGPVTTTIEMPTVRYGVIGTSDGVRRLEEWTGIVRKAIDVPPLGPRSRAVEPQHVVFPGFTQAFGAAWPEKAACVIDDIDPAEIHHALHLENRHEAVRSTVDIFVSRILREHNRQENPPAFWFVVIPEIVYELGRPLSTVPKRERLPGTITINRRRAQELVHEPTLFQEENRQADVYQYETHFRRQLKARLLRDRVITQIVRETTLTPQEFIRPDGRPVRRVEDAATIAWNMCTGAYYKAGGRPWQLAHVRPGVCYVGLAYKRNDLGADPRHACCAAQMFLTHGDGVVFRGAPGPWYNADSREYHLDSPAAAELATMVLEEYVRAQGAPPDELFIHARAAFTESEWHGFRSAVPPTTRLVGVQIVQGRGIKLFRPGNYPVIRGTALKLDERAAYLWTSGYVPRLDTYMGPETPNPLWIRIVRGECPIETALGDVLALTKINFNTCRFNDGLPVTLRFADAVGEVLMAAPTDCEARLPFKHYV